MGGPTTDPCRKVLCLKRAKEALMPGVPGPARTPRPHESVRHLPPRPAPPLLQPPNFQFHDPQGPIYTSPRFLPPAKVCGAGLFRACLPARPLPPSQPELPYLPAVWA